MDYGFNIDAQLKTGLRPHKDAPGAEIMAGLRPYPMAALTPLAIETLEFTPQVVLPAKVTVWNSNSINSTFQWVAASQQHAIHITNTAIVVGDTVLVTWGGTAKTFTFVTTTSTGYNVQIGATGTITAASLAARIAAQSSNAIPATSTLNVVFVATTYPYTAPTSDADGINIFQNTDRRVGTSVRVEALTVSNYYDYSSTLMAYIMDDTKLLDFSYVTVTKTAGYGTATMDHTFSIPEPYLGKTVTLGVSIIASSNIYRWVVDTAMGALERYVPQLASWTVTATSPSQTNVAAAGATQVWPWPQLIGLQHSALIAGAGYLASIASTGGDAIPLEGITHHGLWHVADAGGAWYASNGAGLLVYARSATEPYDYAYSWASASILSVCIHEDTRLLTVWLDSEGKPQLSYGPAGDVGVTRTVPLPFNTLDATILPLGNRAIVYGDTSVCGIMYGQTGDGAINYGFQLIPGIPGVSSRASAVNMGDEYHIVRDAEGWLWRITPDFKATRLGYAEFLADQDAPVLTVDETEREVWISDGSESYLLTESGLGGPMTHCPNGFLTGRKSVGAGVQTTVQFKSGLVGKDRRDMKSITCAHVASQNISNINTAIYGRVDTITTPTRRSKTVNCSPSGMSFPVASFVEGQVLVNGTIVTGQTGRIENVELRKVNNGKRDRRGPTNEPESD